jgi:hypothetical protein
VAGLQVVVSVRSPSDLDVARVERLVREVRPAHLPFRVEVRALR